MDKLPEYYNAENATQNYAFTGQNIFGDVIPDKFEESYITEFEDKFRSETKDWFIEYFYHNTIKTSSGAVLEYPQPLKQYAEFYQIDNSTECFFHGVPVRIKNNVLTSDLKT
ncbi:hypothetical protein EOM86_11140 [Candidatus Nomurabacteria bacterium]|nr:hypothetical protein [Candidatus Nomurabacteria bacterium]